MQTITMNTSDLEGIALDWAAAAADGYAEWDGECFTSCPDGYPGAFFLSDWKPSICWGHAGATIERERIGLVCDELGTWFASYDLSAETAWGATSKKPLVAAMRCFVAAKLGNTVEIPLEIANAQQ